LWFGTLFGIKVVYLKPLKVAQTIMANVEKLQEHLKKAKSKLSESTGDVVELRKLKKKTKRLSRKSSKITATEKMAELKKKKKKDRKSGSSE
jgi:hypothetical protein